MVKLAYEAWTVWLIRHVQGNNADEPLLISLLTKDTEDSFESSRSHSLKENCYPLMVRLRRNSMGSTDESMLDREGGSLREVVVVWCP